MVWKKALVTWSASVHRSIWRRDYALFNRLRRWPRCTSGFRRAAVPRSVESTSVVSGRVRPDTFVACVTPPAAVRPPAMRIMYYSAMNPSFRSILVLSLLSGAGLRARAADPAPNPAETPSPENPILDPFIVNGKLDQARESIVPELGASSFQDRKSVV